MDDEKTPGGTPHLIRHFGTLQATALNMSNMIGIGPFLTIPLLMSALGGPQAMLGWLVALLIVIPDGMVWSELGAAMPGSGGSYVYLREGFGRETFGRLMAFLFIWQFIVSGPFEIASGYIGFAQYLSYLWKDAPTGLVVVAVGLVNIILLYRRITHLGKVTISLWIGTLLTTGAVIATGAMHFDPEIAFDFPAGAFNFSTGFLFGLGAASRIGVYDYLGYYDICYIGDETRDPGRTIPRSIIVSVIAVAAIYVAINLSIIGTVPWRQFVSAEGNQAAQFIVSLMMEQVYGEEVAAVLTLMILWTALGSCFALLLGYSRIPFAAARDGYFFALFSRLHPRHHFPHVSVLVIGALAILCSFFSLGVVIDVLIATRIIVQFAGQIFAVALLRRNAPELERPYRIWLYPLPSLVALTGWAFIYLTLDPLIILFSLAALALGALSFLAWSRSISKWPFAASLPAPPR
ncbi:MAG: APC family permease [Candidatus Latescibacteria bacterium]|nr:APC family permease [Candidatus Latescibacterota bacterium]